MASAVDGSLDADEWVSCVVDAVGGMVWSCMVCYERLYNIISNMSPQGPATPSAKSVDSHVCVCKI